MDHSPKRRVQKAADHKGRSAKDVCDNSKIARNNGRLRRLAQQSTVGVDLTKLTAEEIDLRLLRR
jgi:hypothetical protein